MERVWSQYERMESELSVIRSHLQHICNFGMPQVTFYDTPEISKRLNEGIWSEWIFWLQYFQNVGKNNSGVAELFKIWM